MDKLTAELARERAELGRMLLVAMVKEATLFIDEVFTKCRVVYFPLYGYPIEHNPHTQKYNRATIERAFGVKVEEWKP